MKKHKDISWKSILNDNLYSLRFMWKHARAYFVLSLVNTVFSGLIDPITVVLTGYLFTALDRGCSLMDAMTIVLLTAAVKAIGMLWGVLYGNVMITRLQQELHLIIQKQLFDKARKIELSRYDDPEMYNEFILAMQYADTYATTALGNVNAILINVFSISAIVGLLVYVDVSIMFIMLGGAVASMIINSKIKRIEYSRQMELTPIFRKDAYIDRVFKMADHAKELRLTDLGDKIINEYDQNTEQYIDTERVFAKKKTFLKVLENICSQGLYLAIIGLTVYKLTVVGSIMLGGFAVVVNANWRLRVILVKIATGISNLPQQSMYIKKVRSFMEYEPKGRSGVLITPRFQELELKNVCFGYNKDIPILHDINMTIHRGEKIAIVGYNGAGKTTLVKLLMHLYQPDSGAVLYNGTDIREYETDSYRSHIGAVFQDFKIFAATIGENVMGDECTEADRHTVEQALHLATFDDKLASLPDGIHTMLTREYDENGTNLSGGEAQKIAIARVFAHPFDLVIMDEPSSALDPIAEYTLNQHIAEYAADKTVIFISHRLSTTRHVDRIYMLENGRIIESGSHDELIARNGKYAQMFRVQAEKYLASREDNVLKGIG